MTKYYYNILGIDTSLTNVKQVITVGSHTLTFVFQWAIVSEEQGNMVMRYLQNRAQADPVQLKDGNYNRDYDWFDYYLNIYNMGIDAWLASDPDMPVSLITAGSPAQLRSRLNTYITEMLTLRPAILLYTETMRWQFQVEGAGLSTTTGIVEPGGWFRSQDDIYSFRFRSARDYIGKEDINELAIEFEVYDE